MSPRVMTQSAGWPTVASRVGGTGGRASRGGGRTRGRSGDQGDGRIDGQGGEVGGHGREVNDGIDGVPDFSTIITQQNQNGDATNNHIRGDFGNIIMNNDHRGCTYKEFLVCNPKEYDGKGGSIVYTRWMEKMELSRGGTLKSTHEVEKPLRHLVRTEYKGHFAKDYRVVPRNVNPINARNLVARTCYECGSTNHIKVACPCAMSAYLEAAFHSKI
nr:reverse transcriptase domain-containing protein [Tanacetum cinerariifolium]